MEMKHGLPSARADVHDDLVVGQPGAFRRLGDELEHALRLVGVELGDVTERVDVMLRQHEQVHGRLRVDVLDRNKAFVRVDVVAVAVQVAEEAVLMRRGQGSPPR